MAAEPVIFDAATGRLERAVNLIEASAGTGKTYAIAMLVLRFVTEFSLKIEDILLVTFTRAATEELAERIRKRLVEARDLLGGSRTTDDKTLQRWVDSLENPDDALKKIREALADIDRAAVFTIHGFCQRMLLEQALESGQLFDVELQPDSEIIRQQAARDFWRKNLYSLAPRQCGVVLAHFDTPAKLYASVAPLTDNSCVIEPQTETMAEAFARFDQAFEAMALWWQANGEELAVSLGEVNGAGKMKKCFNDDFLTWWESLSAYFLGRNISFPQNIKWLQRHECAALINGSRVRGAKKEELLEYLGLPERLADMFIDSVHRVILAVRVAFAAYMVTETERCMLRQNIMSYDDLIVRLHRAVTGGSGLRQILRQRFSAALIDEFQDTDSLQWRIFSGVFGEGDHFLYLIGDPKQAIYRFRGADIYSYFMAKEAAAKTLTLTKNFRSHPGVVGAINALFLGRDKPFLFDDGALDFYPVEAAKTAENGRLERGGAELGNMVYCRLTENPEKDNGQWSSTGAAAAVMRYVAGEIVNLLESEVAILGDKAERKLRPGDIAILVRKNSQAEEYQQCLAGLGVPAVIAGRISVFETVECRNFYHLLKAIAQPGDSELLKTAMTIPWLGLSGDDLYRIQHDEKLFDGYFDRFQTYAETWLSKGVQVMMKYFIREEKVILTISMEPRPQRTIANIYHLLELARQAEADNGYGPLQLLQWLHRNMASPESEHELRLESDEEAVRIVTMHGSKGLEFPVVFCPCLWYRQDRLESEEMRISCHEGQGRILDLGSERFEERRRKARHEEMAEEMRLLYVALTRAKYRCYAAWCDVGGRKNGPVDSFDSGLGYLLFPAGRTDFEGQSQRLEKFAAAAGVEHVLIEEKDNGMPYLTADDSLENLTLRALKRESFYTDWRMTSYSALASGGDHSSPPPVTAGLTEQSYTPLEFAALPSGANFGNAVHDILEAVPFHSLLDPQQHRQLIKQKCLRYGLNPDMELLEKMLCAVVDFSLGTTTADATFFSLADLDESKCIKEMGFYFHLRNGDTATVNAILAHEKTVIPLTGRSFKGYLTGFVDLIFEHEGVFYIADYKTNHLGDNPGNYRGESLIEAMASHNYGLQFWLYSLVLHNHLRNFLPDYDYDHHFGGVFYLFVRGMERPSHGVYHHKPDRDILEQLDRCFGDR
ncbi:exodeoxyribonuclease V subunit beta [Desulfopila inferna]|uniref:exodeoxyribonuclease V subunit beta n=1 Tax=Desulfopila inferna TaxID=468528 RepID=UPI00196576C6|nr:exodeoxyribonuclease V subunit beta [Desulfopila inferna]MBM9603322.1 exodeoxyribonuclease V subunit beta [Desulfopila inferna]